MLRVVRLPRSFRSVAYRKQQEYLPLGRAVRRDGNYKLGQHFIHDQLNYRGLVLFPIPHQRYVFDQEAKDYTITDEAIYMVLVDQRDVNQGDGHMVMDIFKDGLSNLRSVEGFDLVTDFNIRPYDAQIENHGVDDFGQQVFKNSQNSFDFENYWYRKFIYDFDGTPKETGNLFQWKYDFFNYGALKTYERTHWPEGIKVSISPVFLAYNTKTQIRPKFGWKYHFKIEMLVPGYLQLVRHTFHWQGHGENQLSTDRDSGIYVGSDFNQGKTGKKHIMHVELSPSSPVFKFTSTKMLEYGTATFMGSLLFQDHRGRETCVTLPSFNISYDPTKGPLRSEERVAQNSPERLFNDKIIYEMEKTHSTRKNGKTTVVSGVKLKPKNRSKSKDRKHDSTPTDDDDGNKK